MQLLRLLIPLWLLFFAAAAQAQQFPQFTGLVVDAASVLPPAEEAAITQRLQQLQQTNGRQVAVLTVPDLQGYPIEDYGYRLGREWGVGLRNVDNGAVIIVAPTERKVRIEVGRGLEPVLTDALSSLIINRAILPQFKAGNLPAGIVAGANAVADQLSLPDEEAKSKVAEAAAEFDRTHRRTAGEDGGIPFSLLFWGIILFFFILPMLRGRRRGRRYRGRGGGFPIILWGPGFGGGGGWGSGGGFGGGGGGSSGGWFDGGFSGGGGGSFGGGGASGDW